MDRNTVLWTIVVFFGASVLFTAVRNATSDESTAVTLGAQLAVGLLAVAAIVYYVKRSR